jgi:hypothetical protein
MSAGRHLHSTHEFRRWVEHFVGVETGIVTPVRLRASAGAPHPVLFAGTRSATILPVDLRSLLSFLSSRLRAPVRHTEAASAEGARIVAFLDRRVEAGAWPVKPSSDHRTCR